MLFKIGRLRREKDLELFYRRSRNVSAVEDRSQVGREDSGSGSRSTLLE
jgi:hypothetical protein